MLYKFKSRECIFSPLHLQKIDYLNAKNNNNFGQITIFVKLVDRALILNLNTKASAQRNCVYILEGNIGAGKSTFLRLVAQHLPQIEVIPEPMATWQQPVNGESILANFFQDTPRWAYTFETLTMMCRVTDHLAQQQKGPLRILERSIYSGHYCFAQNGFKQHFMSELEWSMYNQWFNFLIPGKCHPPHGFIYLRAEPKTVYQRIKRRNRSEESSVPLEYLQQIHDRHEEFLIKKENVLENLKPVPVLKLDCNEDFEHTPANLEEHLHNITQFIGQTLHAQAAEHNNRPNDRKSF